MPPVATKTRGENKLSPPLLSVHHMLDVSLTHGHDNNWTMKGKNRSMQKD